MSLHELGYAMFASELAGATLAALRDGAFQMAGAGRRCLLDEPVVRSVAAQLREKLVAAGLLAPEAGAIQAIAFDKTAHANWKVSWHQDVIFPFARAVMHQGYELPSQKEGVAYARPPRAVLEALLAVRLHLDPCDESNGPLRVSPGSHVHGVIPGPGIAPCVERHGEVVCFAREGDALLMKPLLLHASSPALRPGHRRVLHLVYHSGIPVSEPWHRFDRSHPT